MNNSIFLNAAGGAMSTGIMIVWFVLIFAVMYFAMIRPQKKRQREHDVLVSGLEKGDSILTTSGFYGVVIDVMEEIVIVEFGNNKKL